MKTLCRIYIDPALGLSQRELGLSIPDLTITPIDDIAIGQWNASWVIRPSKAERFHWEALSDGLSRVKEPLSVALYVNWHLCGLVCGNITRFSDGDDAAIIEYVEGAPYRHPLKSKILPLVTDIVENIAQKKGLQAVRITNPAAPAIPLYQSLPGYSFNDTNPRHKFFEKRLDAA